MASTFPNHKSTLYFAFGSNLWIDQMNRRCPKNKLVGVAHIKDWRWIINERGYANIIHSVGDIVYGLVYEINEEDEAKLDIYEGVKSGSYAKKYLPLNLCNKRSSFPGPLGGTEVIDGLVYIDTWRTSQAQPRLEYVYRMNMAIADAEAQGIPHEYIEKYLRAFIPCMDNPALNHP